MVVVTYLLLTGILIPLVVGVPVRNVHYNKTCYDPDCLKTAEQLYKSMDESVNPCDDFYQFTCGRMVNSGEPRVSRNYALDVELKEILEGAPMACETKCHNQLRQFYSLCMDEYYIDQQGVLPAVTFLRQLGRWPLLDQSWSEDDWSFERAESSLQQYGLGGGLFDMSIIMNKVDSDKTTIYIDVPSSEAAEVDAIFPKFCGMPVNNKTDEEVIKVILRLAKQINVTKTVMEESLRDANSIRKMMIAGCLVKGKENDLKSNGNSDITTIMGSNRTKKRDFKEGDNDEIWEIKLTLSQMQESFPSIDWRALLKEILHPSIRLKDQDEIYSSSFEHLLKLGTLMKTDLKKSVANYMMWNAAFKMADYLPVEVSDNVSRNVFNGFWTGQNRWKHCVRQLKTGGYVDVEKRYVFVGFK